MTAAKRAKNRQKPRNGARPYEFFRDGVSRGWRIGYTDPRSGKRRFRLFDTYEEAAAELDRQKGELRRVRDGLAPAAPPATLFKKFIEDYYLPNRTRHKRAARDDRYTFKKHLLPAFGELPLTEITTARVEAFKGRLTDAGLKPATVLNVLSLLGAALRYALDLEMLARMPKIKRPRVIVPEFAYLKTDGEINAFLCAARDVSPALHVLYATAVYTGLRLGELCGLRWAAVDFDRREITVRFSYEGPTKSGRVRRVPLFDPLAPILREWRLQSPGELVFPSAADTMLDANSRHFKETLHDVLAAARLPRLRFHDLRHTFASQWVLHGGDLFKLQKLLGHASVTTTQRYAHLAPDAFKGDLGIFGANASTGEPAAIHELPSASEGRS
jgi:integrase